MQLRETRLLLVLVISLFSLPLAAQVDYKIEITDPQHHLAQVEIRLPKGKELLQLNMPNWRTGAYKILNQANGVRDFKATDARGKKLSWRRSDKSSWLVDNPQKKAVKVSYQLYANELGNRSRHIDETHAYLDATAVFMYEPSRMGERQRVSLVVPKNWRSYSGMESSAPHQFIARNYHQLADSPIETGISEFYEFQEDKRDYQVVIWGKPNVSGEKISKDLQALVSQSQSIWNGYPYHKYLFIIHATAGATGATEHLNSSVIQRPRFAYSPRTDYLKYFLRTAAHEIIHTWNVKAYRPQALVPYDYQQERLSDLLWIAEGSTSYFQDRLLLTGGLQQPKDFFKALSKRIHEFQRRPGRERQSLAEASREKWIAQGGDFATNHSVSIYSEGFIGSWLLDYKLLNESNLKVSYRDLHRLLFARSEKVSAKQQKQIDSFSYGYDKSEVLKLLNQISGKDYANWWSRQIEQPLTADFDGMLVTAGLKFAELKAKDYKAWAGFSGESDGGFYKLTSVERNSPAWQAGLSIGDQLIAINGFKVTAKQAGLRLQEYQPDDKLELTLFRRDELIRRSLTLAKISKKIRQIEPVEKPSDSQKQFFKAWLGVEFPVKAE